MQITTRGRGAVAHLGDEIRALPPPARKQVEHRMRVYFDLVRDTLGELQTTGRLRDLDRTVATFSLIGMILWLPRWFRQDGRLSQEQIADHVASLALGGLLRTRQSHGTRRALRTLRYKR